MRQTSRIIFRSVFRIKVSKRENDRPLGYVGDLSATGLKLLLDRAALDVGSTTGLRLRTRDREGVVRQVDIDAVCMWSKENEKTGYVEVGCTLAEPNQAFTDLVNSLHQRRKTD